MLIRLKLETLWRVPWTTVDAPCDRTVDALCVSVSVWPYCPLAGPPAPPAPPLRHVKDTSDESLDAARGTRGPGPGARAARARRPGAAWTGPRGAWSGSRRSRETSDDAEPLREKKNPRELHKHPTQASLYTRLTLKPYRDSDSHKRIHHHFRIARAGSDHRVTLTQSTVLALHRELYTVCTSPHCWWRSIHA